MDVAVLFIAFAASGSTDRLVSQVAVPASPISRWSAGVAPREIARRGREESSGSLPLIITSLGYGWEAFDEQISSLALSAPETLNFHGATGSDTYFAQEFGPGGDTSFVYALGLGNQLVRISTSTGAVEVVGTSIPVGVHVWSGLAWDPTSETMYACSTDLFGSALYTIDLSTGNAAPIGSISNAPGAIALAAHPVSGVLYTYDIVTDELLSVSKQTGDGTSIGPIGFDANFAQGMDFDDATGELYLAAFNGSTSQGELRLADTTTGATTLIGVLGARSPGGIRQLTGLAIAVASRDCPGEADGAAFCPFDFDGDGEVGTLDLAEIVLHWAPPPGGAQPWDVNCDHEVGFFDLVNLLTAWGDCP